MAGGNHPKVSTNNPSSTSSADRKSRLETGTKTPSDKKPSSSNSAAVPTASTKPQTPKPTSNSKDNNPAPKNAPNPSPTHPKPPTDPTPHSTFASIPPGAPLPPPSYGFHMLERRTIALAEGSVRSYFALPLDYKDFTPLPRSMLPQGGVGFDMRFPPLGPMSPQFRDPEDQYPRDRNQDYWNSLKRKGGEDEKGGRDRNAELSRQRQHLLQYGNAGLINPDRYPVGLNERGEFLSGPSNPDIGRGDELRASKYLRVGSYENSHSGIGGNNSGFKHNEVDQSALKKAFLHFVKLINEYPNPKKNYLENGKQTPIHCLACGRSSKEFPDMHALILHTYNPDRADMLVDHLGLHKALCILMGWNYSKPPDNTRAYQSLSAGEAAANQDDLIMWPPTVLIHNTLTGNVKVKDGRVEGLGNKAVDNILRGLGFGSGKAKSVFGREGHAGIVRVQFVGDQLGLKEAVRLAKYLEKENHGRMNWAQVRSLTSDIENDPNLVKVDEKTGEKTRILYGYLGTVWDLDKVDFEARKKTAIQSQREYSSS